MLIERQSQRDQQFADLREITVKTGFHLPLIVRSQGKPLYTLYTLYTGSDCGGRRGLRWFPVRTMRLLAADQPLFGVSEPSS